MPCAGGARVQPNTMADDVGREAVAAVESGGRVHRRIMRRFVLSCTVTSYPDITAAGKRGVVAERSHNELNELLVTPRGVGRAMPDGVS